MTLARWREIDDILNRYTRAMGQPQAGSQEVIATGDWVPLVDIAETDKAFEIKVEIPDVNKEDVKVSVDNRVLAIWGERKQEKEEEGKKFHRVERSYGVFTRSFTLPDNVDESKVTATFKNGILNLQIQKAKVAKQKAIQVKVE
jgi:HSP20 family protein